MEASFLHGSSAIHTQHKPKIIGCLQETVYCVLVQHFNPEKLSKKKHWPSTVDRHWQLRALEDACNQCQATVHSRAFHKVLEKEGKCVCVKKIRRTLHKVGFQSPIACSKLASAKRNGTNGFMVPRGVSIRNWRTVEGFFSQISKPWSLMTKHWHKLPLTSHQPSTIATDSPANLDALRKNLFTKFNPDHASYGKCGKRVRWRTDSY